MKLSPSATSFNVDTARSTRLEGFSLSSGAAVEDSPERKEFASVGVVRQQDGPHKLSARVSSLSIAVSSSTSRINTATTSLSSELPSSDDDGPL